MNAWKRGTICDDFASKISQSKIIRICLNGKKISSFHISSININLYDLVFGNSQNAPDEYKAFRSV